MICPNCGKEAPDNAVFCKECGNTLNTTAPQLFVPQAQPGTPGQMPFAPQMQPGMMSPQYAAPAKPAMETKNIIIALIVLFTMGFLLQGLFTGTMFKFIGKPDGKNDKYVEQGSYTYNSYSMITPFMNHLDADELLPDARNNRSVMYYQKTRKATATFMDELHGEDDAELVSIGLGIPIFISSITIFIALFFQIIALVHICRKNEEWAWKRMKTTSIWLFISKLSGLISVFIIKGWMNNLSQMNNIARVTKLYQISQFNDIMKIAPQAWITTALCLACMIVCIVFRSKTKQPKQQPAVPMQPVQPMMPVQ